MRSAVLFALCLIAAPGTASVLPVESGATTTIQFTLAPANLDWEHNAMYRTNPAKGSKTAPAAGEIWYGGIRRTSHQAMLDGNPASQLNVAAEYADGVAVRGWCDANENGDWTDDPAVTLLDYPSPKGARAFVVQLTWRSPALGAVPSPREVRIVLEPQKGADRPSYRLQAVRARVAEFELDGRQAKAFLYDGNWDGVYTRDFGDGLFVDVDGNGAVDVDPMSEEFSIIGGRFALGAWLYEIQTVDPTGASATISRVGLRVPTRRAVVGEIAPEVAFQDASSRSYKLSAHRGQFALVYFWASWCGTCAYQAPLLKGLQARMGIERLAILGVSFDTDVPAALEFRRRLDLTWPTTMEGKMEHENSFGWVYRASGAGLMYLVDPSGVLVGRYTDVRQLEEDLARLSP